MTIREALIRVIRAGRYGVESDTVVIFKAPDKRYSIMAFDDDYDEDFKKIEDAVDKFLELTKKKTNDNVDESTD